MLTILPHLNSPDRATLQKYSLLTTEEKRCVRRRSEWVVTYSWQYYGGACGTSCKECLRVILYIVG